MNYTYSELGDSIELSLMGSFTFTDNKTFLSLLDKIEKERHLHVKIDLGKVDFIDSAALGLLLLAKDKCNRSSHTLSLQNPIGHVKEVFKISRFEELFNIEETK